MAQPQLRIATDVGGTFTDLVVFDESGGHGSRVRTAKASTTPPSFDQGVVDVIDRAGLSLTDVASHVHGTTVVINALLQRKGARVGLITTEGFRDSLAIARGNRPDFFNLEFEKPSAFVPRYLRREVPGRLTYTGDEREPLEMSGLPSIVEDFQAAGVEAVAVCLLHSWVNPDHEVAVKEELGRLWPEVGVIASSEITREWREYERTSTAVLSAFVQPVVRHYLEQLEHRLGESGLTDPTLVMQSNGGVATIESATRSPVSIVESGPASGMHGAAELGRLIGEIDVLALDIGGTTAKCSLIENGQVRVMTDYSIGESPTTPGYPALVPVVDLVEIGNGGGSIARVDDFGKLHVGPESAGARPGPVAYGMGGMAPTTTDANLWLGRIGTSDFCGGEIDPDLAAAEAALATIGRDLGAEEDSASVGARGIVRIANNNMINALKLVSVNRGRDPRDFTMIAFGGGGAMHAVALAQELGVRRVVVPETAAVFSAWGMSVSDLRRDLFATVLYELDMEGAAALGRQFEEMEASATEEMSTGSSSEPTFRRYATLRYRGQAHALEIEVLPDDLVIDGVAGLADRFIERFETEYTYRLDASVEAVGLHLVATLASGAAPPEPAALGPAESTGAHTGRRMVDFAEEGTHEADLYDHRSLEPGMAFAGPAVVEGAGTSVVVHPGAAVSVDGYRNLIIDLDGQS